MNLLSKSIDIILKNQSDAGSFIACPTFPTYHYSWIRDGSFIAYSMDAAGEYKAAEKFFIWVDDVIKKCAPKINNLKDALKKGNQVKKDCLLNARFTLDGYEEESTGWGNFQLDAYGTWLWALSRHIKKTGRTQLIEKFEESIDLTVQYIADLWYYPNYDIWEENNDKIHTSTLACLYGGLNAIEEYRDNERIRQAKNKIHSYIMTNCIKNNRFVKYIGTEAVDASLLWLGVPFEVVKTDNDVFRNTVKCIEEDITTSEGGVHRYLKDTYYGGGEWILLSCWLGWYYALDGQVEKAEKILNWVESTADENGFLPEQAFQHMLDAGSYEHWVKLWGKPATPLLWSHAMYIILKKEIDRATMQE